MRKTIAECKWFGMPGTLTVPQLSSCGCERCQQEIEQTKALSLLQEEWRKART